MNNRIQIIMASIISFAAGAFTVNYFHNNSQQKLTTNTHHTKNALNDNVKTVADTKNRQDRDNNQSSNSIDSSAEIKTIDPTGKKLDYIALSAQVESFQELIYEKVRTKIKPVYSSDINKKGNAEKKYVLESNLNEMFSEKKTFFKTSLKQKQKNEQLVLHFNLTDCKRYEKLPTSTQLEDACFYMSIYSFTNNRWYKTSMGGSYSSVEWMGDQPYAMFFTEYTQGLMKASNILRLIVPLPVKSGQVFSLKYISGEFVWDQAGDIEWHPTTEKEIKDFSKYVENHTKKLLSSEEE